jgi:peptidoglycan hydrolase-like protein with peptidoglycan-binding domain
MLVAVAAVVVGGIVFASAKASLTADSGAIAKIGLPLGGGTIQSVSVVSGPHSAPVPVTIRGGRIFPTLLVPADLRLSVQVVVKRPGWIAWLAGSTQRLSLTVTTPAASLRSHYVTISHAGALRLHFKAPISAYSYGLSAGHLRRYVLPKPISVLTLPHNGDAGTLFLSASPLVWESARTSMISYFPGGGTATAVASPAPGTQISSGTPIMLTFSKPVSTVLGSHLPPVLPITQGTWHTVNSHTIQFRPEGYGYGLGAKVQVPLPSGVRLAGGQQGATANTDTWTVPGGSTTRLQQLLAMLGYLPLRFKYAGSGADLTPQAQEAAAVKPPAGKFSWRYANTPSWLTSDWQSGTYGEVTKGAVMAFENTVGMTADGVAGAQVWRALINAVIRGQRYSFGYTVADVSEGSPEALDVWHNGKTVVTTPVNTGIPQAPTVQGTFAVYEHVPVTTMSGTNPDGSHYSDAGIPWVSYFNGGDALHGFIRGSYGTPQSLGCVEMPFATAAQVYPYTPIGTLVHVT